MLRKLSLLCLLLAAQAAAQKAPFRVPEGVEMKPDVVYASIGARQMHLDLYLPKNGKGPYPAVVYIHGGGWSAGNRTAFQRQAAYMATKGYVGACVEYRLSPPSRCQPEGQRVRTPAQRQYDWGSDSIKSPQSSSNPIT